MRVLFLTHRMPFPPNKGEKIRSFHILAHLAKHHEVYLASVLDETSDLRFVEQLETGVCRFVYERIQPRVRRLIALSGLTRSVPITVGYFHSWALQEQVDDVIEGARIEAIVCSSSPMAEYLFRSRHLHGRVARAIRVMDLIDVDSYKWQQYAERSAPWVSWIFRYEARHLAAYEQRIAQGFDYVLVVSEEEMAVFPGGSSPPNLKAMPNGVDLEFFRPAQVNPVSAAQPTLVFTGMMNYWPNVEGVKWFVESVFPRIRAAVPEVELFVVGSRPTSDIKRLGRVSGVVVTGYVEDTRVYLARANVCIVPLRLARGIQNKVLEAMAMGKAIVTTPQGHEGIRAQPGKDMVIAEGEGAFAAATVDLLQDPLKAEQLGREARRCAERLYSWERNLQLLDDILLERQVSSRATAVGVRGPVGVEQG